MPSEAGKPTQADLRPSRTRVRAGQKGVFPESSVYWNPVRAAKDRESGLDKPRKIGNYLTKYRMMNMTKEAKK
jgi:hypothetical protein